MPPDGTRCASLTDGPDASPYVRPEGATARRSSHLPVGGCGSVKLMPAMAGDSDGCRLPYVRRLPVARNVQQEVQMRLGIGFFVSNLRFPIFGDLLHQVLSALTCVSFSGTPFVLADRVVGIHRDGRSPGVVFARRRARVARLNVDASVEVSAFIGRPVSTVGLRSPRRVLRSWPGVEIVMICRNGGGPVCSTIAPHR